MQFIDDPETFWNHADTSVKKLVQRFIAPNGILYDTGTGFGTMREIGSYLLIKKLASEEAKNHTLVALTGIEPVTLGL